MKADVLLGLQWGDEGKGKLVDVLTPHYDIVARFQGGPNAGHTIEFEGRKFVLRSIPSGVFNDKINVIGNGVVFDPILFVKEASELIEAGFYLPDMLKISTRAHVILPTHRLIDAALEAQKGVSAIGTTGKGIGPTYTDKIARSGLRIGDLLLADADRRIKDAFTRHCALLEQLGARLPEEQIESVFNEWQQAVAAITSTYQIVDTEFYLNRALDDGRRILCEGAQGTMLDIDFGSYPFVTSSNTISAGACTGLGLAPRRIGDVYGIFKAYCTRVGSGPFPTELHDATGETICKIGHEFGAVTGRKRRCGWIDLVALRYAIMINGVTKLIMMKSDVLDSFSTIEACVAYEISSGSNAVVTRDFPYSIEESAEIKPVYKTLKGWNTDLTKVTSAEQFPAEFKSYIAFLEVELGVPIVIVSVGPDRAQTISIA